MLQDRMIKGSQLAGQMPMDVMLGNKLVTTIGIDIGTEIVLLLTSRQVRRHSYCTFPKPLLRLRYETRWTQF
jgi:hypothetical protein